MKRVAFEIMGCGCEAVVRSGSSRERSMGYRGASLRPRFDVYLCFSTIEQPLEHGQWKGEDKCTTIHFHQQTYKCRKLHLFDIGHKQRLASQKSNNFGDSEYYIGIP